MSKQAMEIALETLTFYRSYILHETDATFGKGDAAIVALKEAIKQQDTWKNAVLDQCMVAHSAFYEDDAKKTLDTLIDWHVKVALDPSVSSDAQALIDSGKQQGELVPEGYVLVPRKPTYNMCVAAMNCTTQDSYQHALNAWAEMIESAPKP